MFIFLTALAGQAAPQNDNFNFAKVILNTNGTITGSNVDATKQANEPNHGLNGGGKSVWYQFSAPGNGVLQLNTAGSGFDSTLGVYTGNLTTGLTRIAESDDTDWFGGGGRHATVSFGTKTGATYFIAVDGFNLYDGTGADSGDITLEYSFVNADANDNFANAVQLSHGSGTYSWASSNVGASKEPGEPNHMGNAGGRSVWFKYNHSSATARRVSFSLSSVSTVNSGTNAAALFAIYKGSSLNALTPVLTNSGGSIDKQSFSFLAQPSTVYYIAIDGFDAGQGADTGTFMLTYGIAKDSRMADFDNDGMADLTVFRPTDGTWYARDSSSQKLRALQWGLNGDKPLLQKDSTGGATFSVFRPDTQNWYLTDGSRYSIFNFGYGTDIPFLRNYRDSSGVGSSNLAVFRPETGTWWFQTGNTHYPFQFGQLGDIPVSSDFDGDGTDEITVFRPSNGTWYIYNQKTDQIKYVQFGLSGDKPAVADYDADGIADIALYRPSNGTWYVRRSTDGGFQAAKFGLFADKPQPADYDGDGRADYAVFRSGTWWILPSRGGNAVTAQWGLSTDIPVSAPVN